MNPALDHALRLQATPALARDTRTVLTLLSKLSGGQLEVRLPDGASMLFGDGENGSVLQVHDEQFFSRVLARGDIGLAEAYLDRQWDSPDIVSLIALLARNRGALGRAVYGSWRQLLTARIRHWLHSNSRAGSKRNIMAHYDLGNTFYQLWLDPSMSYSAAIYRPEDDGSLLAAQQAKYRRILDRLQAKRGERVLEIGCGWGAFARMAVAEGLHVTGVTLSPSQLMWAQQQVPQADLRLQDYRDIREQFDHLVSIEMFEAVGEKWWPTYFATVAKALRPGGRAIIQSITIHDELFAASRPPSCTICMPREALLSWPASLATVAYPNRYATAQARRP